MFGKIKSALTQSVMAELHQEFDENKRIFENAMLDDDPVTAKDAWKNMSDTGVRGTEVTSYMNQMLDKYGWVKLSK